MSEPAIELHGVGKRYWQIQERSLLFIGQLAGVDVTINRARFQQFLMRTGIHQPAALEDRAAVLLSLAHAEALSFDADAAAGHLRGAFALTGDTDGSGAAPTTTMCPRGTRPLTSGDIEEPLAAVAMIAAAPPSSCNAAPGSPAELSM